MTGVVHDIANAPRRFGYLAQKLTCTRHRVRLIAVSGAVRDALLRAGVPAHQVHTVPNGLDVAAFQRQVDFAKTSRAFDAVRDRNDLPSMGTMVLISARRVEWKGHADVIEAVRILARRGITGFYVLINGKDLVDSRELDYEFALARRITAARLNDRVFLLDELSPVELAGCYDAAAIAVHPSRRPEPWGYANIEAMLAGCAVITTGHGGPLDYMEHGQSGLLVPPFDPASIADALHQLLTDPNQLNRIAERGRAVASQFTVEAMATRYQSVITATGRQGRGRE